MRLGGPEVDSICCWLIVSHHQKTISSFNFKLPLSQTWTLFSSQTHISPKNILDLHKTTLITIHGKTSSYGRSWSLTLIKAFPISFLPFLFFPHPQKGSLGASCTICQPHTLVMLKWNRSRLNKFGITSGQELLLEAVMLRKLFSENILHLTHPST